MDRIGKYEVLDKIGSGGFAVVYKGYDPFIKRPVAIKVCYARDPETRERFHREAEIAGLLVHRNITTVYDFGLLEQTPYLVEEYLPGEDLAHMIRRREPAALAQKLDFLAQITSGLGYAHSKGVIHRDVKPANIRVLESGRIKIMDFGTAKLAHVESDLTQTGMTLGTVAYLSPERLLGQPSGTNSDLFSFGVLAYELLSFRRPFTGRNIPSLIDQVLSTSPKPLSEVWPECPPKLQEIVHRCLEKDPAARYPSCEPILAELERVRAEHTAIVPVEDSSASVPGVSVQLSGLLERARQLYEHGRYERAEVLLDEVSEIDPENLDATHLRSACRVARRKAAAQGPAGDGRPPAAILTTPVWEPPEARRARKISEAVASIRGYVDARELAQAAEALRFAVSLFGGFDEAPAIERRLAEILRRDVAGVRDAGLRQARETVGKMESLRRQGRLPPAVAKVLAESVAELDSGDLAARRILEAVRRDERRATAARPPADERKQAEAVASIEKLLADGDPATAAKALEFALRLFGELEQAPELERRISEALGRRS